MLWFLPPLKTAAQKTSSNIDHCACENEVHAADVGLGKEPGVQPLNSSPTKVPSCFLMQVDLSYE